VAVPALNAGGVHELGTLATCLAAVKGRLVGCNGEPVTGIARLSTATGLVVSAVYVGNDGRFVLAGPSGSSAVLEAFANNGASVRQTVQMPAAGSPPLNLGDVRLCTGTAPTGSLVMSFTLNGDGRTNEVIELRDATHYYDRPQAFREGSTTKVIVGRSTQTGYNTGSLVIPGTGVGSFATIAGTLGSSLGMGIGSATTIYYETSTASGNTLNFVVTQYDAVGGRIKGTFSGTMRKRIGSGPLTTTTVTVSNGTFDFLRTADQ
jgi:hypothetical protein